MKHNETAANNQKVAVKTLKKIMKKEGLVNLIRTRPSKLIEAREDKK